VAAGAGGAGAGRAAFLTWRLKFGQSWTFTGCELATFRADRGRLRADGAAGMPGGAGTGRGGGRLVGNVPGRAEGVPAAGRGCQRGGVAGHDRAPQGHRRHPGGGAAARGGRGAARAGRREDWGGDWWAARPALPARQRAAVAYHYLAGLPYAQIAEITGGSTDAARRAAADGIKTLRATYLARTREGEGR